MSGRMWSNRPIGQFITSDYISSSSSVAAMGSHLMVRGFPKHILAAVAT